MEAQNRPSIIKYGLCRPDRFSCWSVLLLPLICISMGAQSRTPNFVIETSDPAYAQQAAQTAEKCRHDLAIEWLGEAMPNWAQPCVITIQVGEHLGAGGATQFVFDHGEVFGWRMTIQGSKERVLDSVLPHEITHMIFASHFRRPLPRWADEGGATSVEHSSEREKQRTLLIQFLRTGRGIAFNRMFAMTEYPRDMLPLYAQGYSLADFLIQTGGRRKYIEFIDDGLDSDDWSGAVVRRYGFQSLGVLQNTWLSWVKQGWPQIKPRELPSASSGEMLVANQQRTRPEPNLIYHIPNKQPAEPLASLVPVQMPSVVDENVVAAIATTEVAPARRVVSPDRWVSPSQTLSPPASRIAAADTVASTVKSATDWRARGEASNTPTVDPFSTQVARPQATEQPR